MGYRDPKPAAPAEAPDETPSRSRQIRPAFHQIEVFLKVVETRSFVAAARQLGITQPAVSQTIHRLEDIYSGELFVRNRRAPLTLTPIGEAILPFARTLIDTVDRQIVRAAATAVSQVGALTIGFYPGMASGPLREGLADFIAECPGVHLRFAEGLPGDLHRQLSERSIDIMFTAFMPDMANPALVQEPLWQERLVAVLPAGHPLARRAGLSWDDIATQRIILRTAQGELAGYRAILQRIGDQPLDCEQHAVSRGALLEMVALGLGITVSFPSACIPRAGIVTRTIEGENAVATIEAIWPSGDANPIRHRLVRYIRERAAASDFK
jgi:LysR family hydrogen peroxide-inducible transcriptional activator